MFGNKFITEHFKLFSMYKQHALFLILFIPLFSIAQKLYVVPGLNFNYYGLNKVEVTRKDINTPKPHIGANWFVNVKYKTKKLIFSLSLKQSVLGTSFKVRNIYVHDTILGIRLLTHADGIDQLHATASVEKETNRFYHFVGNSLFKINFKAGFGIGFNRTQSYYKEQYSYNSYGMADPWSFIVYEQTIKRKGIGYYLSPGIGLDFYNKKKRKILFTELYYDFGLKKMTEFNMNYEYAKYLYPTQNIDPNQYTRVLNYKVFTRGSTFGLKIGIPIKILK